MSFHDQRNYWFTKLCIPGNPKPIRADIQRPVDQGLLENCRLLHADDVSPRPLSDQSAWQHEGQDWADGQVRRVYPMRVRRDVTLGRFREILRGEGYQYASLHETLLAFAQPEFVASLRAFMSRSEINFSLLCFIYGSTCSVKASALGIAPAVDSCYIPLLQLGKEGNSTVWLRDRTKRDSGVYDPENMLDKQRILMVTTGR